MYWDIVNLVTRKSYIFNPIGNLCFSPF